MVILLPPRLTNLAAMNNIWLKVKILQFSYWTAQIYEACYSILYHNIGQPKYCSFLTEQHKYMKHVTAFCTIT